MKKFMAMIGTAFLLIGTPTAAYAAEVASAPAAVVHPNCCASAWYPWENYGTKAECEKAGQGWVKKIPTALDYKCQYISGKWKLYILEAG